MNHPSQQPNPALDQLRTFVTSSKIVDVTHESPGAPMIFILNNGSKLIFAGNFQLHMEPGSHDHNVVDVIAKESKDSKE